jgi:hypothetical protein
VAKLRFIVYDNVKKQTAKGVFIFEKKRLVIMSIKIAISVFVLSVFFLLLLLNPRSEYRKSLSLWQDHERTQKNVTLCQPVPLKINSIPPTVNTSATAAVPFVGLDDIVAVFPTYSKAFDLNRAAKSTFLSRVRSLFVSNVENALGDAVYVVPDNELFKANAPSDLRFLWGVIEAYRRWKGQFKWLIFGDSDTYFVWSHLLPTLAQFNHTKPFLLGPAINSAGNGKDTTWCGIPGNETWYDLLEEPRWKQGNRECASGHRLWRSPQQWLYGKRRLRPLLNPLSHF